ncbi:M28 family peptidase [uncultured Sphingomonas sp.]|uniref:M28 family peptidase n=1 Tax=uncultured Sphingomonas sp. TaxID=158754 RepID=UPI0035C9EBAC
MKLAAPIALALSLAASGPRDAETRAWWATTATLSNDAMEGRDTGSPGYDRAARVVAARFAAAGLTPLGAAGGWFQTVPMAERAVTAADLRVGASPLAFLHDYTVNPVGLPARLDAPLAYRGYCGAAALGDVRGRLVICHATRKPGLPGDADRAAALRAGGAAGMIAIADPGFTVEPPRWPFAYARSVRLATQPAPAGGLPQLTLNADALGALIAGSGQDAARLIADGSAGRPLPAFDPPARLTARFAFAERSLASPNILALLPGTDPALADQAIVLTAHLDGYGRGEPVNGDGLYNGTLDDAAYVALLIRLAERRAGRGFRRPVIFAAVTGEEKGLLGSAWLVAHPPVPLGRIAADINLDQLRPIFPLTLLTVHALDDTTLGDDARAVAAAMGVQVQNDPEPERGLLRRSDHWNFLKAGVPAVNFVFGYRPGTQSERIYRQWYRTGYHKPQDDLAQRIDWKAAADFNRFFFALVARVADQDRRPAWKPGSTLAPK